MKKTEKKEKSILKYILVILIIILITMISFIGIYVNKNGNYKNIVSNYSLAMELEGNRTITLNIKVRLYFPQELDYIIKKSNLCSMYLHCIKISSIIYLKYIFLHNEKAATK